MMSSWILSTFGLLRLLGGTEQSALLSDGVKAIEKNCSDCYGRSRAELQEGIDKVERYLAENGSEKARAYRALSDGYGVKLFFSRLTILPKRSHYGIFDTSSQRNGSKLTGRTQSPGW